MKKNYNLKEWIEEYKNKFVDVKKLKKSIDEYMKNYDEQKAQVAMTINKCYSYSLTNLAGFFTER